MSHFLEEFAAYLLKNHTLHQLDVVLPNQRAAVFLKKHLAQQSQQTILLPNIWSADTFIAHIAQKEIADENALLLDLYRFHLQMGKNESFDVFMQWAKMLLSDFNEIDRYLINAKDFFSYMNKIRALENWNISGEPLTALQLQYLDFWQDFFQYYTLLQQSMQKKNAGYQGFVFRQVAENPYLLNQLETTVIYAGFNALTKAEETIIRYLLHEKKAKVFWDVDAYYLNDKEQEAGLFLRRYALDWAPELKQEQAAYFFTQNKQINVLGFAQQVAQAKWAGQFLAKTLENGQSLDGTALVLADEKLLLPLLQSLPNELKEVNITMGLSAKYTSMYDFLDHYLSLLQQAKLQNEKMIFNGNILLVFLKHAVFESSFIPIDQQEKWRSFMQHHFLNAQFFIEQKTFIQELKRWQFENLIVFFDFSPSISTKDLFVHLQKVLAILQNTLGKVNQQVLQLLNLEVLFEYQSLLSKYLLNLQNNTDLILSYPAILKLLRQEKIQLSFYGNPTKGLQIMGMLESRNLDFDRVILLGANEGFLPATPSNHSFIPNSVRRDFSLPTYQEKDAIFAYHFYRLLQRCPQIYLTYNTEVTDAQKGEKSRWISQLLYELPLRNTKVDIQESIVEIPLQQVVKKETQIPKTTEILEQIKQKMAQGISPSAWVMYQDCSLNFYYQHILGIKPLLTTQPEMTDQGVGNVLHQTLAHLLMPYQGQKITIAAIEMLQKSYETGIHRICIDKFPQFDCSNGHNYLAILGIKNYIKNWLNNQKTEIETHQEIEIVSVESGFKKEIILPENNKMILNGQLDLLKKIDGVFCISDYKTGNVQPNDLQIKQVLDLQGKTFKPKAFQLLCYAYLAAKKNNTIRAQIAALRLVNNAFMDLKIDQNCLITEEHIMHIEVLLQHFAQKLLDPATVFRHNEKAKFCPFCI